MGKIEPIDKTLKKIKKKWEQDKEGWSVLSNVDKDGNKEMMISQAPNTWWLKMKQITPYRNMAFGQDVKNMNDEIDQKIQSLGGDKGKKDPELLKRLGLFAMGVPVPKKKEMLFTSGVEMHNSELVEEQKEIIEEKDKDADRLYRKYLREKWKRTQQLRDNMYS